MDNHEETRKVLTNRHLIIIEDNEDLSNRLQKEFKAYGAQRIVLCHTVESGLKELREYGLKYDLIIVDVMLPLLEDDYKKIQVFKKEELECLKALEMGDSIDSEGNGTKRKLQQIQQKLLQIKRQIGTLICSTGGIDMVAEWVGKLNDKIRPPILYLTAKGDIRSKQKGFEAAGVKNTKWLVKPVAVDHLMDTAATLISKRE